MQMKHLQTIVFLEFMNGNTVTMSALAINGYGLFCTRDPVVWLARPLTTNSLVHAPALTLSATGSRKAPNSEMTPICGPKDH